MPGNAVTSLNPDFALWKRETLNDFAAEILADWRRQREEIENLQANLRDALHAYRQEVLRHAGKAD